MELDPKATAMAVCMLSGFTVDLVLLLNVLISLVSLVSYEPGPRPPAPRTGDKLGRSTRLVIVDILALFYLFFN